MSIKAGQPGRLGSGSLLVCLLAGFQLFSLQPASAFSSWTAAGGTATPFPESTHEIRFSPWEQVLAAAFSPDGSLLAAAAGQQVHIYSFPAMELQQTLQVGTSSNELAFLANQAGQAWVALAGKDGSLQIWDAAPGKQLCKITAHRTGVSSLAVSASGRTLATSGNDAFVRIWDLASLYEQGDCPSTYIQSLVGASRIIPGTAYHPSENILASIDRGQVRLRDPLSTRLVQILYSGANTLCIAFHPQGKHIAVGEMENIVRIWDTETGENTTWSAPDKKAGRKAGSFIWRVAFNHDGSALAAATSDSRVFVWQFNSKELQTSLADPPVEFTGQSWAVASLAYSPDGRWLAAGTLEGVLRVWLVGE